MFLRIAARVVNCVKTHRQFILEFENHGSSTWVFMKTWKTTEFVRVTVTIIDPYYNDLSSEAVILGKILCAIGIGASLISLSGGSHTPVDCYKQYLGNGYTRTLVDYPTFDFRLLKRCLQKFASLVFGTRDPFSRTDFIVIRLKGS